MKVLSMLNKPIFRKNGREYGFNLTVYFFVIYPKKVTPV